MKDEVCIPSGDFDLRSILEEIDRKIALLVLVEQGVALNQHEVGILAQRLELQRKSLGHMLTELQMLVRGLHALAAKRETGPPIQ
jgi:hypothetical protein